STWIFQRERGGVAGLPAVFVVVQLPTSQTSRGSVAAPHPYCCSGHSGYLSQTATLLSVDDPGDMARPLIKRFLPLGPELMPWIDRCNTRDRAALMIQDLVGNMRRNAEPRHARHASAAQVMQTPAGHPRKLIQPSLGPTERQKRLGVGV